MKLFKKAKKGFTLVELVVVIAVIAILSAVSVGAYFGITDSANNSRLEQETKQLHTNIQAISLGTSSNQSLGKDGLTVADIDQFELDLEANAGEDFEVLTSTPLLLSRPTVVLSTSEYSKAPGELITYHTFEYYNPDISNKKVISDIVTGDMNIENIPAIPVDKTAEDVSTTLIYFKNTDNWDEVYIYGFRSSDSANNKWPGEPMSRIGDTDYYAFYLTSTFDHIVFNNNNGIQSSDQSVPNDENNCFYYDTSAWSTYGNDGVVINKVRLVGTTSWNLEEGIEFTKVSDTVYTLENHTIYKDAEWKVVLNDAFGVPGEGNFGYDDLDDETIALNLFEKRGSDNGNIFTKNSAKYTITLNYETKSLHVVKGEDVDDPVVPVVYPEFISLIGTIGDGADWDTDYDFVKADEGKTWTLNDFQLNVNEEFKVRQNHAFNGQEGGADWGYIAVNHEGANEYLTGTDTENTSSNILVNQTGVYDLSFDYDTKLLTVVNADIQKDEYTIWGSFTEPAWDATSAVEMTDNDSDGILTVELNLPINAEFKIRQNGSTWIGINNVVKGETQEIGGADNFESLRAGTYVISYNPETTEFSNTFTANSYTLTINPTPADATVVLTAGEAVQSGNSITVVDGTTVSYTVSKDGYTPKSDSVVVTSDKTIDVTINEEEAPIPTYTFTINPTPADATVTLTGGEATQEGNSITVADGTDVEWTITKDGYHTRSGSLKVSKNIDKTIDIVEKHDFYLDATLWDPSSARFEAYFFGTGNTWVTLQRISGTNIYGVNVPEGSWTNVIFCRMDPNKAEGSWDSRWNQTANLTFKNYTNKIFKVGSWDNSGDSDWSENDYVHSYPTVE